MTRIELAHTGQLDAAVLQAAHDLLVDVFEGDFADDDWEHALGGMHALAWHGAQLVGHASLVQRRLLCGGRVWRTGYVEGVGVRADLRGRGHGAALMSPLEELARGAYDLAALGAADGAAGFYAARGWQLWQGPTSALTPQGVVRTPDEDGGIFVLAPGLDLDLTGELTCDWRDGDVW